MSTRRLQLRVPSARFIAAAVLPGFRLTFHKIGRDGSGKCDALARSDGHDRLFGVVWHIDPDHKVTLDGYEDLGRGYAESRAAAQTADGRHFEVFLYTALRTDQRLRPYDWYREHVLRGALEHRLPEDAIAAIRAVDVMEDQDSDRRANELAVYHGLDSN